MTKKKVKTLEELEQEKNLINDLINKRKAEENAIKREERNKRIFAHGAHLEAIFGPMESEELFKKIFKLIYVAKKVKVKEFENIVFDDKVNIYEKKNRKERNSIDFLINLEKEVKESLTYKKESEN